MNVYQWLKHIWYPTTFFCTSGHEDVLLFWWSISSTAARVVFYMRGYGTACPPPSHYLIQPVGLVFYMRRYGTACPRPHTTYFSFASQCHTGLLPPLALTKDSKQQTRHGLQDRLVLEQLCWDCYESLAGFYCYLPKHRDGVDKVANISKQD